MAQTSALASGSAPPVLKTENREKGGSTTTSAHPPGSPLLPLTGGVRGFEKRGFGTVDAQNRTGEGGVRGNGLKWTPQVIAMLREMTSSQTREEVAAHLGVTIGVMSYVGWRYGIYFKPARALPPRRANDPLPPAGQSRCRLTATLRAEIDAAHRERAWAPPYRSSRP